MNLQEKINKSLRDKQNEPRTRSGLYNPSSFGRCFRYQYWNRLDLPQTNPPDERALRIFKSGKIFHDFVQSFVDKATIEVKCENDDLCGYADIVTDDEVIDIKSVHSNSFHYMRKETYDVNKEKESNILQVLTYAWLLGKPKGRLVFVSRDDLCIAEYVFYVDKWRDRLQDELEVLKWHWEHKSLPNPKSRAYGGEKSGAECLKYCPYRERGECAEYRASIKPEPRAKKLRSKSS